MLGEGESLETPTFKRQVGEEPEKEPEQLLRLATEKWRRMALRKDTCLEETEGDPEGQSDLGGPGLSWGDQTGCGESSRRLLTRQERRWG